MGRSGNVAISVLNAHLARKLYDQVKIEDPAKTPSHVSWQRLKSATAYRTDKFLWCHRGIAGEWLGTRHWFITFLSYVDQFSEVCDKIGTIVIGTKQSFLINKTCILSSWPLKPRLYARRGEKREVVSSTLSRQHSKNSFLVGRHFMVLAGAVARVCLCPCFASAFFPGVLRGAVVTVLSQNRCCSLFSVCAFQFLVFLAPLCDFLAFQWRPLLGIGEVLRIR